MIKTGQLPVNNTIIILGGKVRYYKSYRNPLATIFSDNENRTREVVYLKYKAGYLREKVTV